MSSRIGLTRDWKKYLEHCATFSSPIDPHGATTFVYRPRHDRQSQSCSLPRILGGEERVEDALPILVRHTGPVIRHEEHHAASAGWQLGWPGFRRPGASRIGAMVLVVALPAVAPAS